MKRIYLAGAIAALCAGLSCPAKAQMGMNIFQKPAIAKFVNPVVGQGAQYETTRTDAKDKNQTMELSVVGKESVDGQNGFWMEVFMAGSGGKDVLGKMLFTMPGFEMKKIVFQMPGQGAMEMPFNGDKQDKLTDSMKEWHQIGTETITVPAGTFLCEHWRNDSKNSDMWASDKVTPFGMVKEVEKDRSMILTKQLTGVQDRITGPVQKFDPQMFMQQHRNQQKP